MFYVSEIDKNAPKEYKTDLQRKVYQTLGRLQIPYERVDTEEAITMEDCIRINDKLDMKMVKTLFLCNRQKTRYYLFITKGEKAFSSKDFSNQLKISRVSFAPAEMMENMLGTKIGAATVFSALLPEASDVQIILDKEVVNEKYYGCSDGTTTSYMKIETGFLINKFLPYTKHVPVIVEV